MTGPAGGRTIELGNDDVIPGPGGWNDSPTSAGLDASDAAAAAGVFEASASGQTGAPFDHGGAGEPGPPVAGSSNTGELDEAPLLLGPPADTRILAPGPRSPDPPATPQQPQEPPQQQQRQAQRRVDPEHLFGD